MMAGSPAQRPGDGDTVGDGRASRRTDAAFGAVLGSGRGITEAQELRRRLADATRELAAADDELRVLRSQTQTLDHGVQVLSDRAMELEGQLAGERLRRAQVERERDQVRYKLVRAGGLDVTRSEESVHQGVWTCGRPYLSEQHVYHPRTGNCYVAVDGGVRAGLAPGRGRRWHQCGSEDGCPVPATLSRRPHPLSTGYALRQHPVTHKNIQWFDAADLCFSVSGTEPKPLADDHLLSVIVWLQQPSTLASLWISENHPAPPRVPCPANAYTDSHQWLADTPLFTALVAEKRRRGLRITERIRRNVGARLPWPRGT